MMGCASVSQQCSILWHLRWSDKWWLSCAVSNFQQCIAWNQTIGSCKRVSCSKPPRMALSSGYAWKPISASIFQRLCCDKCVKLDKLSCTPLTYCICCEPKKQALVTTPFDTHACSICTLSALKIRLKDEVSSAALHSG